MKQNIKLYAIISFSFIFGVCSITLISLLTFENYYLCILIVPYYWCIFFVFKYPKIKCKSCKKSLYILFSNNKFYEDKFTKILFAKKCPHCKNLF